jgi:hypothetical protein
VEPRVALPIEGRTFRIANAEPGSTVYYLAWWANSQEAIDAIDPFVVRAPRGGFIGVVGLDGKFEITSRPDYFGSSFYKFRMEITSKSNKVTTKITTFQVQ